MFESLTYVERLQRERQKTLHESNPEWARHIEAEIQWRSKDQEPLLDYMQIKPTYFNSGCCCYADGDITGLEIADGYIRLIKWKKKETSAQRQVLNEAQLKLLIEMLE